MGELLASPSVVDSNRLLALVVLTNPKTLVFLTAILPDFVDRSRGHVTAPLLQFGLVFVLLALVCDSTWGLVAGTAREWFARSPQRLRRLGAWAAWL